MNWNRNWDYATQVISHSQDGGYVLLVELKVAETPTRTGRWSFAATGCQPGGRKLSFIGQCHPSGARLLVFAFRRVGWHFIVCPLSLMTQSERCPLQKQHLERSEGDFKFAIGLEPVGAADVCDQVAICYAALE